jgi:hypothetical protein
MSDVPLISYDEAGLVEHDIGDVSYRIDSGKQGTALAISTRSVGSWDWAYLAEVRWDGIDLRCKELDYETRAELTKAFKQAIADME